MVLGCENMKKGFTLAELIGVLVVLALIGMIAVPAVAQAIKENKRKICSIQFSNITEAAQSWAANNIGKLPADDEKVELTFDELMSYGYLEDNLTDPKTSEAFSSDWKVVITKVSNRFDYKVYNGTDYVDPSEYCN